MRVALRYGHGEIEVDVPSTRVTVIAPTFVPGLEDEAKAFRQAVRQPIGTGPLRDIVGRDDRLAIAVPDITRALPSDRLLPWLFEELRHVPKDRVTILVGTGSHRVNTEDELRSMLGPEIVRTFRVINHSAHDPSGLVVVGHSPDGHPVTLNRWWVEADRRIVLGFIEPHFMAGFSGGYKGVFPALAGIDAIMRYHGADVIGHPGSTWGRLDGNPTQAIVRANGSLVPLDFCINVTLNREGAITRFFCGDPIVAHESGCEFARTTAMVGLGRPFPIVLTTNSGYPLDQNLYQAVKGMSAAAQVVDEGGLILAAARCNDGFPAHGNFRRLMVEHDGPRAILDTICAPGFSVYDQWEAQMLALIQLKARVGLYSELPAADVSAAHLEPVEDIGARLADEIRRRGDVPIAVLPEGPMTIPYLRTEPVTHPRGGIA